MLNLSSFTTVELVTIFMIMTGVYFLLKSLYRARHQGKLLIIVGERKFSAVFWILILVVWGIFLINDIREYVHYKELLYKDNILYHVLWIEVCVLNIIGAIKHSQIRERGMYISFYFFKWSRITSYTWILPNVVELRISTLLRVKLKFKLILNRSTDKSQIDEILQRYIIS